MSGTTGVYTLFVCATTQSISFIYVGWTSFCRQVTGRQTTAAIACAGRVAVGVTP